jgi:hypothetical protein
MDDRRRSALLASDRDMGLRRCLAAALQYATDETSEDFLRRGVFSCYRPVAPDTPMPTDQRELSVDDYHRELDRERGGGQRATEMLVEMYVPRGRLPASLEAVREDFRAHQVDLIYGTIRLIERDDETFLAWAREPWACIVFNLHVVHSPEGVARATGDFRRLIDIAIAHGASYFPTYHRWATRGQVEACHPRLAAFLRHKRAYDPEERFQSEWYRHCRRMFADAI